MINLLPPEVKSNYRYARRSVGLRKWVVAFAVALVGLGGLATYGLLTFQQSSLQYSNQVAAAQEQLEKDKLTQTKKQVQDISSSLKLAVQVLSNEVLFSKLITQIGSVMPQGTILSALDINKSNTGLDLQARAVNYYAATQIQVNLTDPANKVFAKVDIVSISCNSQQTENASYPCLVQLRALFNSNNQFLFINQGSKP